MKDIIKASEAAPAKTQLSSDTARMFDLINQIGAIHEELRGIYEGTYMITGKWMKRWGCCL